MVRGFGAGGQGTGGTGQGEGRGGPVMEARKWHILSRQPNMGLLRSAPTQALRRSIPAGGGLPSGRQQLLLSPEETSGSLHLGATAASGLRFPGIKESLFLRPFWLLLVPTAPGAPLCSCCQMMVVLHPDDPMGIPIPALKKMPTAKRELHMEILLPAM